MTAAERVSGSSAAIVLALALSISLMPGAASAAGTTERVSVSTSGQEADDNSAASSGQPSISDDGRYVAFDSFATNLAAGDTQICAKTDSHGGGEGGPGPAPTPSGPPPQPNRQWNCSDVFLHDRDSGTTTLVSRLPDGSQATDDAANARISGDGSTVFFNYRNNVDNPTFGLFAYDVASGSVQKVSDNSGSDRYSVTDDGSEVLFEGGPNGITVYNPTSDTYDDIPASLGSRQIIGLAFSGDGRFVAFGTDDPTLVPNDTNEYHDTFVWDRVDDSIERASVRSDGAESRPPGGSYPFALSDDGRFVAFHSWAYGLVSEPAHDTGGYGTYVHDMETGTTTLASVWNTGARIGDATGCGFSDDGRFVAFQSYVGVLADDPGFITHVYVHDLNTGATKRVTVGADGAGGGGDRCGVDGDGTSVAFVSPFGDLVAGDTNQFLDVFVREIPLTDWTATTTTASGESTPDEPTTVSTNSNTNTDDPFGTQITVPAGTGGGPVSVSESPNLTNQQPSGYSFLNQEIDVTAPDATWDNPLELTFRIDASALPTWRDPLLTDVFRNGELVQDCLGATTALPPDAGAPDGYPCVSVRALDDGDLILTILTPHASLWNFGTPTDTTNPTASIATPADGASYTLGRDVRADYSCADGGGDSAGLASCEGGVANGAAIDTSEVGVHTFSVTATDNAGNSSTSMSAYNVVYDFGGFYNPVVNRPGVNVMRAGDAIRIPFSLGGDQGLQIWTAGSDGPQVKRVSCQKNATQTQLKGGTNKVSGLSYESGRYFYAWKTDKSMAGSCYRVTFELNDGTEHPLDFKLN